MDITILAIILILAGDIYFICLKIKERKNRPSIKEILCKEFFIALCIGLVLLGAGIYVIAVVKEILIGIFLILLAMFPLIFIF